MKRKPSDKAAQDRRWVCPTCGRNGVPECRPFCSQRCADLDLGRWLNGGYVLPGSERPGTPETDDDGVY